jgi:TRAP-type transport system periplasmic protein
MGSRALVFALTGALIGAACGGAPTTSGTSAPAASGSAAAASTGAPAPKIVLRLGNQSSPTAATGRQSQAFADAVNKQLAGRVEVQHFPNSQLGDGNQMLQNLVLGTLEMQMVNSEVPGLDPKLALFEIPFIFNDEPHLMRAMDAGIFKNVAAIMDTKGIHPIAVYWNGFRTVLNTQRPIVKPTDMAGMKLRVGNNKWRLDTFKTFGANPTPLAFTEVYTALQTRALDGLETIPPEMEGAKLNEVAKYLSLVNFSASPSWLVVSKKVWDTIPADLQRQLEKIAQDLRTSNDQVAEQINQESIARLRKTINVNDVDTVAFKAATSGLIDTYAKQFGRDWLDIVEKTATK